MAAPSDVNKGDVKTEEAIQQRTGTESMMTQRSQSGVIGSSPGMQMPVFEYSQPGPYFKQFRRYVRVLGIDAVKVHDLLCYSLGAGARSQWLADLVEESVVPGEGDSAEAVVERVEELVLKALQPEVLKSQILQGLENKTLKPGQSPREFVEEVRAQLMSVMPELTQESVSRLLILHTVKGAPAEWRQRLLEANFTNVDDLVHKLTLLQSVRGQSNSARRVAVNRSTGSSTSARRCYACHKVGHIARDCTSGQRSGEQSSATRCSKCTLRGHDAGSCRTQCRKCHQTGHIQAHCTSGSAPVSRRVVVGSTYSLEVQLQGKPMTAVLDSGSEKTLVSKVTADLVGLRVQPSNRQVLGPGKEQLIVYGCSVVHLAINGDEVVLEVLVTDCRDSIILGTDFLRAAEVSVDFGSGQVTVFGHPVEQRPVTVCRCSVAETFEDEVCDLGLGDEADFVPPFQKDSKGKPDLSHLDDGARQQVGDVVDEYADVFSVRGELGSVTGECEQSFQDLKEAITSYPVVRSADVSQPFVLTTDACGLGWGCTLSQTCDGKEYVVAYASGKWSRPETRYSTTEHELLAVIRAARRFRHFLLGVHFTVVTDHQALKWLWNIDDPSGRLARWILHLSQFDFEVQHRRGVDIPHADALSRDPVSEDSAVTDCGEPTVSRCVAEAPPSVTVETDSVPAVGGDQTAGVGHSPFDLPSELQQATREDPVLSAVLHCLQTGDTDDERLGDAGTFYMRGKDSLFVRDGLVCRQTTQDREPQIIVPSSMQSRIIRLAHDVPMSAHFGVTRTLHQITRRYFWYNLKVTVRDYCRSCLGCARVKRPNYSHREGIGSVPVVGEPFAQWSADILGPLPRTERWELLCAGHF